MSTDHPTAPGTPTGTTTGNKASETKRTTRRDTDPVRVYKDGRIWYWSSGVVGVGKRTQLRCGTLAAAELRAAELRAGFARGDGGATLDEVMQKLLDNLREVGDPQGTIVTYKSDWNTWVPAGVGELRCSEVEPRHFKQIFDHINAAHAAENRVSAVARTLGAFMNYAINEGYFHADDFFGSDRRRRAIVKKAKKRARIHGEEQARRIHLDTCPTLADVEAFAEAFEAEYPGYGRRLVWLAYASGLRINELLALKVDAIDVERGEIVVDWQLDRYQPWPAVRRPKGGRARTAIFWLEYRELVVSLIDDALARAGEDHGWLFPRHRSKTGWADQCGKLGTAARQRIDWDWPFHWQRHAWASVALAPESAGGYGFVSASVSRWLGHRKTSTTTDMYQAPPPNDAEMAAERTRRPPGIPAGTQ